MRAHLLAKVIICTQEPFAVPAVLHDVVLHLVNSSLSLVSSCIVALQTAHSNIFRTCIGEQSSNHNRFCNLGILVFAVLRRSRSLEGFARFRREAGQVDAVVPVCTHCQRQAVRANIFKYMIEALFEVIHHGLCLVFIVVIRNLCIQNAVVAGFLDVSCNRQNHPQRVIGEVAADFVVALLGERLILVIASAIFKLGRSEVDQTFSCTIRNLVNEAQQVLVGVTEAHTTADTAFKVRSRTGHVKGNHALILVPDVYHTVHLVIRSLYSVLRQQVVPHFLQSSQTSSHLFRCVVLFHHCICSGLVHRTICIELFFYWIFNITQDEDQLLGFARLQGDFLVVGSNRRPAVCNRVGSLTSCNNLRIFKAVVQTQEGFSVSIITVNGIIYGVESKVVSSFLVFGLVEDGRIHNFNFASVEVPLEVGGVILCIPQTPFYEREQLEGLCFVAFVLENNALNFAVVILRNEERNFCGQTVFLTSDDGITHTVTAFIAVQFGFYRSPARRPDGIVVLDVEVTSAHINWNVVVTVSGDSAETSIFIEVIAAGGVGDEGEERLCAEVVDPRVRGLRILDDVFLIHVVEVSKFHNRFLSMIRNQTGASGNLPTRNARSVLLYHKIHKMATAF